MSIIVAIESGTEVCSVVIARDGEVVAMRESAEGRDHARLVASYVDELLKECNLAPSDISAVAVSQGPGSYTGLRIGVSFAKGLCYGLNIPLIGVSSLESLTEVARQSFERGEIDIEESVWDGARLCPMVDARRMEVYTQILSAEGEVEGEIEAKVVDAESFAEYRGDGREMIIFGDGAAKCADVLEWVRLVGVAPSARGVAKIAHQKLMRGEVEDVAYFEPFYLKDVVITTSKRNYFNLGNK